MAGIIHLENIRFSYPGSQVTVLDGLNLEINTGDRIGLMAPNGSGKTTIFRLITGEDEADEGDISFSKRIKIKNDKCYMCSKPKRRSSKNNNSSEYSSRIIKE